MQALRRWSRPTRPGETKAWVSCLLQMFLLPQVLQAVLLINAFRMGPSLRLCSRQRFFGARCSQHKLS